MPRHLAVPEGEPRRSRRISVVEGSFANVHFTITTGWLLTAYALFLDVGPITLGLLTAMTALASFGSILGAQAVGLLGRRRPLAVAASVSGRGIWVVLIPLAFLDLSRPAAIALFLATVLLGGLLLQTAGTAWLSWMTDLVPLDQRGRYFGIRNAIHGAVGMATGYAAGRVFDRFVAAGRQADGFAWILGFAVACAVVAGGLLYRQWEPPLSGERRRPLLETIRRPVADPAFRPLLRFVVLWSLATGVAAPFFVAHMVQFLEMTYSTIAVYSIIAGLLNLLTQPLWGRIIDRLGNRPVLAFNLVGVFLLPALWLFATPDRHWPIWLDAALTGIFWPGFTLAGFNLLLVTAPDRDRSAYLGVHALAVGVFTFLASVAGGLLADIAKNWTIPGADGEWIYTHFLFGLSALLRICLLPLALRLHEDRAQSVARLLDLVGDKVSQGLYMGWRSGVTVVRRIGRP